MGGALSGVLLELVDDCAIAALDRRGRFARWGVGAERLYGYDDAGILGLPLSRLFVEGGVADRLLRRARRGPQRETVRQRRQDGTTFEAEATLAPMSADAEGYALIVRPREGDDEADRIAAIVTLQQELADLELDPEDAMQRLVEGARRLTGADGALMQLVEGDELVYRAGTGGATRHVGRRMPVRASLAGRVLESAEVLWSDDAAADPRVDQEVVRSLGMRSVMVCPLLHGGRAIGALKVYASRRGAFGRRHRETLTYLAGFLASSLVRATERHRFRTVLGALPISVFVTDPEGRIVGANAAARALWGFGADPIGRPVGDAARGVDLALRGVTWGPEEVELDVADARKTVIDYAVPIRDEADRVVGATCVSVDISQRKAAEERLRLLESLVERANDGVMITDTELDEPGPRIDYVNEALARLSGYAVEELLGRSPRMLQGAGTDRAVTQRIRRALERREAIREELLNYRKDGSPFYVDVNIVPVTDARGKVTHFASVQRDTTERREAEAVARRLVAEAAQRAESEAARRKLERVLESITDAFIAIDRSWRIVYVNHRAAQMIGIDRDALVGRDLWTVLSPEATRAVEAQARRAMDSPEPTSFDVELEERGIWLEVHAYPSDEGLSVYLHDVTARKQAERSLRDARLRLELALSAGAVGTWTWDPERDVVVADQRTAELYGVDTEQAAGGVTSGTLIAGIPPDEQASARAAVRRVLSEDVGEFAVEYRIQRDGMGLRWVQVRGRVQEVHGRRILAGAVVDVTERRTAEDAVRAANETLSAMIDASPFAIVALDLRGCVELWNPAAERLFGWAAEEVLGGELPCVPGARRREVKERLALARQGRGAYGVVTERVCKDGTVLTVSEFSAPLAAQSGTPRGVLLMCEDITEREAAQAAQRRLTAILEATPDVVLTAELDGRLLYVNEAGRRRLRGDEPTGGAVMASLFPEPAAMVLLRDAVPAALRDGIWTGSSVILDADGREVPVSQVLIAHRDDRGQVEYLSTILRDLSEQKRAEEAQHFLASASRRLASSLEIDEVLTTVPRLLVPALARFVVLDLVEDDGTVTRARCLHADPSQAEPVARLAHYPLDPEASLGPARTLRTAEPEIVPRVTEPWLRVMAPDPGLHEALRALRPTSQLFVPLWARGRVLGVLTLSRTGGDPPYTEADLLLAQELAVRAALAIDNARLYRQRSEALRARDDVFRFVAHDLRTPLVAITLAASVLERRAGDAGGEELTPVRTIARSAERASRLVNDLLDVGRIESGSLPLERRPEALEPLLREVVQLYRMMADQAGVQLTLEAAPVLPTVLVDRDRLVQGLGNLVGNALKFTPRGGRITLGARRRDGVVEVWVSDTGAGIAPEQLGRVFDMFWQGRSGGSGAGLGLAITRGIAEAHGGRIDVESEPGCGTTFTVSLPIPAPG